MELVRWRPRRDLPVVAEDMGRAMDRLIRNWMSPLSFSEFSWSPTVDIQLTLSGVLTVRVPKAETAKAKKVEIS
ncbi:MAG: hypothetical protein FJY74_02795 [Candidatus Eisenbacteria bacterium]|nr:hypothetical protein [Candidatus Eisenbacteria bacterium]